jgi:outer membrane protein
MNRKGSLAAAIATALLTVLPAHAEKGDWLVRARALYIDPSASSSALNLDVSTQWTPEIDFSYFVTRNVAFELILATQRHQVTAGGVDIGSVKHLPPTLTLQYHLMPEQTFRPYVGAGINYTRFYDINLSGGTVTVDRNSWGGALQVGFDYGLNKNMFLNFDIKKIWIDTDVKVASTGAFAADLKIDPLIVGVGLGWKF